MSASVASFPQCSVTASPWPVHAVLGIELTTLCMLGKQLSPMHQLFLFSFVRIAGDGSQVLVHVRKTL